MSRDTSRVVSSALFTLPALLRARGPYDRKYATALDWMRWARGGLTPAYTLRHAFASGLRRAAAHVTHASACRAREELAALWQTWRHEGGLLHGWFESLGSFSALFKRLVGPITVGVSGSRSAGGGPPSIPGCVVLM